MEERVTELEIRLAHLEQSLAELNEALVKQQRYIDRLEAGFEGLREQMRTAGGPAGDADPAAEKPPHY